jgi:hypothetical protein
MLFNAQAVITVVHNSGGITIDNNTIEIVEEFKYLGFIIDNKLKFNHQHDHVLKKMASCNGVLAKASPYIPVYSQITLYKAIGLSHILYSKFILISLSPHKLLLLQKKTSCSERIIKKCIRDKHDPIFNAEKLISYYVYLALQRIIHGGFCPSLKLLVEEKPHTFNTRNKNCFYVHFARNEAAKKGFWYLAPQMWNRLPAYLRDMPNFGDFKSEMWKHLFE